MSVFVFANGELSQMEWIIDHIKHASVIIAADGGAQHLLQMGYAPDIVIGDMDSITSSVKSRLKGEKTVLITHPVDKNETDLELALLYAVNHYKDDVVVLGAFGGRFDQTMGNILLLAHPDLLHRHIEIRERHQRAWIIQGEARIEGTIGDLVSLIPLGGNATVLQTAGLKWSLDKEVLTFGLTRGISNVMTAQIATLTLESGCLLCVHTSQEYIDK